ncbi:class III poly(R)-hydroxyalkanoic acid synthase subunit PhaE [Luteimonas sp. e5]
MQADWPGDFEALARQYWSGWNQMMRQAAGGDGGSPFASGGFSMPGFGSPAFAGSPFAAGIGGAMPPMGAWQQMLGQWARMASALGAQPAQAGMAGTVHDTLGRFQAQAGDWFARMQVLSAQLAGQALSASEIAERWKAMLQDKGGNAWLEMFRAMQSPQMHGFEHWYEGVQPMLAQWRAEARDWLDMPTFGVTREHQERLQRLFQAQLDYQDRLAEHNALLAKSSEEAFRRFEELLARHEAPGEEITSARALFDLWIDAAEDAFAKMALSPDYRDVYGRMVNTQMQLRRDVQGEIERFSGMLGMPTRTEIEAAHRKIAELERALRRLQRGESADAPRRTAPARKTPARKVATRKVAKKAGKQVSKVAKAAAKQPAARKTAAKRSPVRKKAAKAVKRSR